jgi:hypothetical protein
VLGVWWCWGGGGGRGGKQTVSKVGESIQNVHVVLESEASGARGIEAGGKPANISNINNQPPDHLPKHG